MSTGSKTLADLPPELLDQLLRRGISHHVITLWKCGNIRLNQRLAQGGATKVVLSDKTLSLKSRWPCMLSELKKLRSLEIICGLRTLDNVDHLRTQLQRLSPTLEDLTLDFFGSVLALMKQDAVDVHTTLDGQHYEVIQKYGTSFIVAERTAPYENVNGMWDLDAKFPNLTSLHLRSDSPLSFLREVDLAALPRSLTALRLPALNIPKAAPWTRLDLLPPNLRKFIEVSPHGFRFTDASLRLLPRSITHLDVVHITSSETLELLPPGLQSALLKAEEGVELSHLPPTLTSYTMIPSCGTVSLDLVMPLPLTSLVIHYPYPLNASHFKMFPRTLTSIHVSSDIDWSSLTSSDIMPATLIEFGASDPSNLNIQPNTFKVFPASLRRLNLICRGTGQTLTSIDYLPPNLELLALRPTYGEQQLISASVAKSLPRSLTSLSLFMTISEDVNDFFDNLPGSLTSLSFSPTVESIRCADYTRLWHLWRLESLTLRSDFFPSLSTLPRTLHAFAISAPGQDVPAVIVPDHHLVDAPPNLSLLSLPNVAFPCRLLHRLPRTLQTLYGIHLTELEAADSLRGLPPKLQTLMPRKTERTSEYSNPSPADDQALLDSLPSSLYSCGFSVTTTWEARLSAIFSKLAKAKRSHAFPRQ